MVFVLFFHDLFDSFSSFQAWLLPSWQISLQSTVYIPLFSPSSRISSWALLTRWSQVNQSDLCTEISPDDSDKLPELHGAALRLTLPILCSSVRKIDVTPYFLCPGTFAVLSIMVGIVCLRLAPESDFSHFNATLNATIVDTDRMNEARLAVSGTLACLTAIIQVFLPLKAQYLKVKTEIDLR